MATRSGRVRDYCQEHDPNGVIIPNLVMVNPARWPENLIFCIQRDGKILDWKGSETKIPELNTQERYDFEEFVRTWAMFNAKPDEVERWMSLNNPMV